MKKIELKVQWLKILRKYTRLKTRLSLQQSKTKYLRDLRKIEILKKRILKFKKSYAVNISTVVLTAWLANPVSAQDTIQVNIPSPRVTEFNGPDLLKPRSLDFNGDGYTDIFFGEKKKSNDVNGRAYVVFGDQNGLTTTNQADIDGTNGFFIDKAYDCVFTDINNDGKDDIIGRKQRITVSTSDAFVIFGTDQLANDTIYTAALDSADGFHMIAPSSYQFADDFVALDDFNGDGINDVAVFDYYREYYVQHPSFVLFGSNNGFDSIVNLDNMTLNDGLILNHTTGNSNGYKWGTDFASGDINGDGISDLVVADQTYNKIQVMYGSPTGFVNNQIDWDNMLNGTDGFKIEETVPQGGLTGGVFGWDVSVPGDVNGDGYDDIMFSDNSDSHTNDADTISTVFTVYGNSSFNAVIYDYEIVGNYGNEIIFQNSHTDIGAAGDLNGDGLDDVFFTTTDLQLTLVTSVSRENVSQVVYGNCEQMLDSIDINDLVQAHGGIVLPGNKYFVTDIVGDYNYDGYSDQLMTYAGTSYILNSEKDTATNSLYAGVDTTFCDSNPVQLNGQVEGNVTQLAWSSSGTGTFSNDSVAVTSYNPSLDDVNNGAVTLYFEGIHPSGSCVILNDSITLALDCPTGVYENSLNSTLTLFPNPSNSGDVIYLNQKVKNVKVFSATGQLIKSYDETDQIDGLVKGMYFLISELQTIKIIVS
ncbi:T9SS type A sorting domain-containing protein [Vicingus serpentipes]|uniref:T9SS type A sorting domain-containing protein n=1 Tax=Vicingus serpentipes TaxID=1926625 RepID=A0A5C6RQ75_9FLAO|nr:T9SS type A sorting domain-containing protein [Vicingus serpentipes]TXB64546.1 T9SS type A sorting domain-containing protein [Vicingus serpentipes]